LKHLHSIATITLLALLTGCGGVKTTDTVFPTSTDVCAEQASQTRFIVRWENGLTTVEKGSSADNFRSTFVSDNLHMIRHVDQDQQIQVRQQVQRF
jgi:hypothetical protein